MYITDHHYIKGSYSSQIHLYPTNLKTNFDKILDITKSFFEGSLNTDGNFYRYPNKPKMSDSEIIALSLLCETIGIDSENYLFGKLKSDHHQDFPNLIS